MLNITCCIRVTAMMMIITIHESCWVQQRLCVVRSEWAFLSLHCSFSLPPPQFPIPSYFPPTTSVIIRRPTDKNLHTMWCSDDMIFLLVCLHYLFLTSVTTVDLLKKRKKKQHNTDAYNITFTTSTSHHHRINRELDEKDDDDRPPHHHQNKNTNNKQR